MLIYVLVISFSPLVVYAYCEGFARFSSKKYESKIKNNSIENYFVHLTNHSVQKKGDEYNPSVCDLKWPLHKLRRHARAVFDARIEEKCFKEIENSIKLSCEAVKRSMIRDERCFELYGYDFMFDNTLKPWLIEVNASPSMTADSVSDKTLKTRLFEDVLNCVDFEKIFEKNEDRQRQGALRIENNECFSVLARIPPRVGGFDVIANEAKEENIQKSIDEKKYSIGNVNVDREKNLKDNGILSEDEDEDKGTTQKTTQE